LQGTLFKALSQLRHKKSPVWSVHVIAGVS